MLAVFDDEGRLLAGDVPVGAVRFAVSKPAAQGFAGQVGHGRGVQVARATEQQHQRDQPLLLLAALGPGREILAAKRPR